MSKSSACGICRRAIDAPWPPFCPEHLAEQQVRHRRGVSTEELSRAWCDTLQVWAERPAELADVPDPNRFDFFDKFEGWVLFWRRRRREELQPDELALPDWIAVNKSAGEVRRYTRIGRFEIKDRLVFEYRAERTAVQQQLVDDLLSRPDTPAPVRTILGAQMPVYAPLPGAAGLALRGVATSSGSSGALFVRLTFLGKTDRPAVRVCVLVSEHPRRSARLASPPVPPPPPPPAEMARRVLSAWSSSLQDALASTQERLPVPAEINGTSFAGESHYWRSSGGADVSLFDLRSATALLRGATLGLPAADVTTLLSELMVLQEHPELLVETSTPFSPIRAIPDPDRRCQSPRASRTRQRVRAGDLHSAIQSRRSSSLESRPPQPEPEARPSPSARPVRRGL